MNNITYTTPLNLSSLSFDCSEHDSFSPVPLAEFARKIELPKNHEKVFSTPTSVDLRFSQCPGTPKRKTTTQTTTTVCAETQTTTPATVKSSQISKIIAGLAAGAVVGALSSVACMMRLFK